MIHIDSYRNISGNRGVTAEISESRINPMDSILESSDLLMSH